MNNKLIMIFGIRRSGIHLTANFLASQFDEPVHVINNQNVMQMAEAEQTGVDGKLPEVNARVVIFEEHPAAAFDIPKVHNYFPTLLGGYKEIHRIVLVRDPYNLFASRIKHYPESMSVNKTWVKKDFIRANWLTYCDRFQNPEGMTPVSYNELVRSKTYRRRISKLIGADHFSDKAMSAVDPNGGGSSFSGTSTPDAQRVLQNHHHYSDLSAYRDLFEEEYVDYSNKIFNMKVDFTDEGLGNDSK